MERGPWMEKMRLLGARKTTSYLAAGSLLGLQIFAALFPAVFGSKFVLGKENSKVVLPCQLKGNVETMLLEWYKVEKSDETLYLRWDGKQVLRASRAKEQPYRFLLETRNMKNEDFSVSVNPLRMADGGEYKCKFRGQEYRVHLYVFRVDSSLENPLLLSEDLTLKLNSSSKDSDLNVTWWGPRNQSFQNEVIQIKNLDQEHSGVWKCHIHHAQSAYPLEIIHKVELIVLILSTNTRSGKPFSMVNETVEILCVPSIDIRRQNNIANLKVLSAGIYKSNNQEILGQQVKAFNVSKDGGCQTAECSDNQSQDFSISLPHVQLSDAGWYTCLVTFSRGAIQQKLQLLIGKVSAEPQGPVSKNTEVILTCEVSHSLPRSVLRWTHVNGSSAYSKENKDTRFLALTLRANASHLGLWRCSVSLDSEELGSMYHRLEERSNPEDLWFWATVGVGSFAILVLTICSVICGVRRRRRRRARRMAQIKKHLYEKKTCQCKGRLATAYYQA